MVNSLAKLLENIMGFSNNFNYRYSQFLKLASFLIILPSVNSLPTNDALAPNILQARQELKEGVDFPMGVSGNTGEGQLKFNTRKCNLGLWQHYRGEAAAIEHGAWEGWPLGINPQEPGGPEYSFENRCFQPAWLHKNLDNQITAFMVSGYCECEFFDDYECTKGLFTAFNREHGRITRKEDDDTISSVKCWYTDHRQDFKDGQVTIGLSNSPFMISEKFLKHLKIRISPENLEKCMKIIGPYEKHMEYYKINGVTCEFYSESDCMGELLMTAGNSGKVDGTLSDHRVNAASFKCFLPWGAPSASRDDQMPPP